MHANAKVNETILKLVPGGEHSLAHLSDSELLTRTRRLVGASNRLFAELLLHLAEVETRGIHRTRACASLYTYCVYELRMSEDAAARRSCAARWVKRFPLLFDAVANGELHLTGLLMLGPHLTLENHVDVLARAKFRTKKELAKLIRELHPLPRVPDVMQPLGPELPSKLRQMTYYEWVTSLAPPVRELKPGESPKDWANDAGDSASGDLASGDLASGALVPSIRLQSGDPGEGGPDGDGDHASEPLATAPARRDSMPSEPLAAARHELPPIIGPQQYQVQFCATEEHVKLVDRAKALLARTLPGVSLGELHLQAMKLLVEKLEKEKFAVTQRPRTPPQPCKLQQQEGQQQEGQQQEGQQQEGQQQEGQQQEGQQQEGQQQEGQQQEGQQRIPLRRRGRHIPAAVKRQVFLRDGGRCGYMDERGERCRETRYLELHHLQPFARAGGHVAENLSLRCAAHNELAAEEDFGRELIERARRSGAHASFAAQTRLKGGLLPGPDD